MSQELKLQNELETLLDDVSHGMESEIVAIREQIHQIKSLLTDAIASLHDSFASIDHQSSQQMKLFSSMMAEIIELPAAGGDPKNIFQHVAGVETVLTALLEMLMQDGRKSLDAVTAMTEIVQQTHAKINAEKKLSVLLEEINRQVQYDTPDIEKIRALSASAVVLQGELSSEHVTAGSACVRVKGLVSKLASRDMAKVFAAKDLVEEILDHLNRVNVAISDSRNHANVVNAELRKNLGSAIRALQFEDIVSQSLGHTDLHLERMDGFVSRMANGIASLHSKGEMSLDEYAAALAVLHAQVLEYRNSIRLEEINPVTQESMDEGDVELF